MNSPGSYIMCPICQKVGKKQVLGKLTDTGQLIVLRFHHGTTIIESSEYQVKCGCGFALAVSHGTVVTQHL